MNLQAWAEKWGRFPQVLETIPGFCGHTFSCVGVTGSTNDDLKNDWIHLPVPLRVHVAAHQTSGRGQYGRVWLDNPDESLLFSFSWQKPVHEAWVLPPQILAGLTVHKALEPFFGGGLALWLKWPNDVWAGRGKLAGILAEATVCGDIQSIIIGIGLNLKGKPDLAGHDQRAVSLSEFGLTCEAETILEGILRSWDHFLNRTDLKALVAEYQRRAGVFFSGKVQIKVTGDDGLVGVPSNLDEAGGLWINAKEKGRRLLDDARKIQILFG